MTHATTQPFNKMIVIGVSGKMGVGKDWVTNNIIAPILGDTRWISLAFADQIKINVAVKYNMSHTDLYGSKTARVRQLLQQEGTDIGRTTDKDIWTRYMDRWLRVHQSRGVQAVIISDVRFENEIELVRDWDGIMVRVVAPQRNRDRLATESKSDPYMIHQLATHASETALDHVPDNLFDVIIHNDVDDAIELRTLQRSIYVKMAMSA